MNPELKQLEERVAFLEQQLRQFSNQGELDPQIQRTIKQAVIVALSESSINDFSDVDAAGATNGQVLKFTTTGDDRWIASTDLT